MRPAVFFTVLLVALVASAVPHIENIEARCLSEGTHCYGTVESCCAPYRCQYILAINSGVHSQFIYGTYGHSGTFCIAVLHTLIWYPSKKAKGKCSCGTLCVYVPLCTGDENRRLQIFGSLCSDPITACELQIYSLSTANEIPSKAGLTLPSTFCKVQRYYGGNICKPSCESAVEVDWSTIWCATTSERWNS